MIRFLFKQPAPRRFSFKPRFYDESKEFVESRRQAVAREMTRHRETGSAFKVHLQHAWRQGNHTRSLRRSNRNVIVIAAILALLIYLLLR